MKRKTTTKSVSKKPLKKVAAKKAASNKAKPKAKVSVKTTSTKALKGNTNLKKNTGKVKAAAPKTPVAKTAAPKKEVKAKAPVKASVALQKAAKKIEPKIDKKPQVAAPVLKKYKPNTKTRYTPKELKHFKDIILEERRKIIQSAKANMEALVDDESGEYVGDNSTYATHMAEQGTDEMEREKNYMFVQRDEKYLGYLEEALIRIDAGTYGVCIDCIETPKNLCRTCPLIDPERLELVPVTQHCIECKNLRGMVNY